MVLDEIIFARFARCGNDTRTRQLVRASELACRITKMSQLQRLLEKQITRQVFDPKLKAWL